jgi:sulfide:quinone oxidoreductase
VPDVLRESGLTEGGTDGWVKVDARTLATPYDGIWALGDCADAPVPRAGVFALSAARVVAEQVLSRTGAPYDGTGICYLELGDGRVGKVDANFLGGPSPVAPFSGPSAELAQEKQAWADALRARWFGGR